MIFNMDFSVKFTDKHFNKIRHNHAVCNRRFCSPSLAPMATEHACCSQKRHLGFRQVWVCLSAVSVPVLLQFTGLVISDIEVSRRNYVTSTQRTRVIYTPNVIFLPGHLFKAKKRGREIRCSNTLRNSDYNIKLLAWACIWTLGKSFYPAMFWHI